MACIHRILFSKVFGKIALDRQEIVYYNVWHHLGEGDGAMPCIVKQMDISSEVMYTYETEIVWEPGTGPKLVKRMVWSAKPETGAISHTDPVPIPGYVPMVGSTPARATAAAMVELLQEKPNEVTSSNCGLGDADAVDSVGDGFLQEMLADTIAQNQRLEKRLKEMERENDALRNEAKKSHNRLKGVLDCLHRAESSVIGVQNMLDLSVNCCMEDSI